MSPSYQRVYFRECDTEHWRRAVCLLWIRKPMSWEVLRLAQRSQSLSVTVRVRAISHFFLPLFCEPKRMGTERCFHVYSRTSRRWCLAGQHKPQDGEDFEGDRYPALISTWLSGSWSVKIYSASSLHSFYHRQNSPNMPSLLWWTEIPSNCEQRKSFLPLVLLPKGHKTNTD